MSYKEDQSDDVTKRGKSFKKVIVRFAEKTSMQGVPYINSARRPAAKAFWSILLILAIVAMSLHLYLLISTYLKFPKKTAIELSFNTLVLPAVTICNVNPFRMSKANLTSERMQRFLRQINPKNYLSRRRRKRFVDEFDKMNLTDFENDYEEEAEKEFQPDEDFEYTGARDTIAVMNERFKELYMDMDRGQRIDIGHDIDIMLLRCSFNGISCYAENFTLTQSPEYGNCFTFESSKLKVKKSSPESGLSLMLYLQTHEFIPGITDGYGARLQIHNQKSLPFPYESGIFLQSGHETDVALRLKEITRAKKPYGSCATNEGFKTMYRRTYTRQACQYLCVVSKMLEKCNCYDDTHNELFIGSSFEKKYCKTLAEYKCIARVRDAVVNKRMKCNCPEPCTETDYTSKISSRDWPTDGYMDLLRQSVCEDFPEECPHIASHGKRELSKNFLRVVVYYEELNFESITEGPDIEDSQFASDVGGAIGLWIGLSMLSVFEVIQLVGELIEYFAHKCRHTGESQSGQRQLQNNHNKHEKPYSNNVLYQNAEFQNQNPFLRKDYQRPYTTDDYIYINGSRQGVGHIQVPENNSSYRVYRGSADQ